MGENQKVDRRLLIWDVKLLEVKGEGAEER
jgi:hypothetical protein